MDENARRTDAAAPPGETIPIPTIRQVLVRALPVSAVMLLGIPALVWLVLDPDGHVRMPWWPLVVVAFVGVVAFIDHFAKAPRPRFDKGVSKQRWKGALASAPRFKTVPTDPEVRTAAGVIACSNIEGLIVCGAILLGLFLGELLRPALPWWTVACGAVGAAIGTAFRSRGSWAYLKALHATPPPVGETPATRPPEPLS